MGFRARVAAGLRSWQGKVALGLVAVMLLVGAGAVYLRIYAHSPGSATTRLKLSSPNVPQVGAQAVAKTTQSEYLSVVGSTPGPNTQGAPIDAPITLSFNLPVDPTAVQDYFSISPSTPGTFAQGPTPQDVLFKPTKNFPPGSSVNVVVRPGLTSKDNFSLDQAYSFRFLTQVSSRGVLFAVNSQPARLASVESGKSVSVTTQAGDQVPNQFSLQIYKASANDLLNAFVHGATADYTDNPIGTSGMQQVDSKAVNSGDSVNLSEPDGIYLVLAADQRGQYGALWLDFSKYGVLLRQDDQKIVVAGEDLTTGDTNQSFDISFYRLQDSPQVIQSGSFKGTGEFSAGWPTNIDLAIASSGGEDVIVPISAPETNADLKVVESLDTKPQIFLTTDRAGYQRGETVKFGGVARLSNDQSYSIASGSQIGVWNQAGDSNPVATARVAADGTFSGSFRMPDSAFNSDGTIGSLRLYADTLPGQNRFIYPYFIDIQALPGAPSAGTLKVTFDRPSYLAGDTVHASISGTALNGAALANKTVSLSLYDTGLKVQPAEMDSFPAPNTWGDQVGQSISLRLDGSGRGTYDFKANAAQRAADQEVTLTAAYQAASASAFGARTAIVYQGAGELFFLASRSVYQPGDQVVAPFVAETHNGERISNAPVAYEFDKTDYQGSSAVTTVVASGTLTTDPNGMGAIRTTYSGPTGQVVLRIAAKDEAGNSFGDVKQLNVTKDPVSLVSFGATDTLSELSVTTDKIAYLQGDTAHLTVTSPNSQSVFLSLERGRIHQSRWLHLDQGDNQVSIPITADLAPGFTVMFSYFRDGVYITEGLPLAINNQARVLHVTITPDRSSYSAGQTAHVQISVTDSSGSPVSAALLVDGYTAAMSAYKLVDQPSIDATFLAPDSRATNASSSLIGVGGFGGRCGGGGFQQSAATNPGRTIVWSPDLATGSNGRATIDVPVGSEPVRIALDASTTASQWGQAEIDLPVQ